MPIATLLATMIATTAPTAGTAAQATPVATAPHGKRYCIKDRRDGSIARAKVCRTREAWRARGFDPVVVLGRP